MVEVQEKKSEFQLTEKIVQDGSIKKRETLILCLDYSSCNWKKVKRTKRIE